MYNRLLREYRFKFYLNASHSIIINGRRGEIHPHTWEITLDIVVERSDFMEFNAYEKAASGFFAQYQDRILNDIEPFDVVIPTLENIVEYFGERLRQIMRDVDGELVRIEGSETPTRSYIVTYTQDEQYMADIKQKTDKMLDRVIDEMLESVLNDD